MESIREAGGKFRSLSEPRADTTTHAGKMIMTIFAGIADDARPDPRANKCKKEKLPRKEECDLDDRESLLWIRVNWHVALFKAKPFPTSPEPLTFTLQRFTDSLTPIRQTFRWPCIHEHAMCRITVVV
jgi:hypothetical protein